MRQNDERIWEEDDTQEFYIQKPLDPLDIKYLGRIYVRIPNPKESNDTYASFKVSEMGKSLRQNRYLPSEVLGNNYMNWVEEIPSAMTPEVN